MQIKVLLILLFLFCFACEDTRQKESDSANQEVAFDETKWKTKKGRNYPYRDSLLQDLITNDKFRELKKDEVLDLLGEPTKIDDNYLFYRIKQKRIYIWTLHTKTLVINLSDDGSINWMKIHE